MIADLNLAIAIAIWVMAVFVAWDHWNERHPRWRTIGLTVLVLATVNLLSAIPAAFELTDYAESFRFIAAFLRGVGLVLLLGYAWFRWEER